MYTGDVSTDFFFLDVLEEALYYYKFDLYFCCLSPVSFPPAPFFFPQKLL